MAAAARPASRGRCCGLRASLLREVFHVEHYVLADLYVHNGTYIGANCNITNELRRAPRIGDRGLPRRFLADLQERWRRAFAERSNVFRRGMVGGKLGQRAFDFRDFRVRFEISCSME
jgi:hypothetical protein